MPAFGSAPALARSRREADRRPDGLVPDVGALRTAALDPARQDRPGEDLAAPPLVGCRHLHFGHPAFAAGDAVGRADIAGDAVAGLALRLGPHLLLELGQLAAQQRL